MELSDGKLQLAKKLSFKSTHRVKIGAVIARGKHVIGVGFNKINKTHPLITRRCPHKKLHAEVDALIGIDRHLLRHAVIYVYRERLDGQIGMCKPCPDCQAILREVGIHKAFYTDPTERGNVGELKL